MDIERNRSLRVSVLTRILADYISAMGMYVCNFVCCQEFFFIKPLSVEILFY